MIGPATTTFLKWCVNHHTNGRLKFTGGLRCGLLGGGVGGNPISTGSGSGGCRTKNVNSFLSSLQNFERKSYHLGSGVKDKIVELGYIFIYINISI